MGFTLFAALAGDRVGQRSVAGVSCHRHTINVIPSIKNINKPNLTASDEKQLYPTVPFTAINKIKKDNEIIRENNNRKRNIEERYRYGTHDTQPG
jgi:hypothetical protein